jgi:RHS repeat-associated protein
MARAPYMHWGKTIQTLLPGAPWVSCSEGASWCSSDLSQWCFPAHERTVGQFTHGALHHVFAAATSLLSIATIWNRKCGRARNAATRPHSRRCKSALSAWRLLGAVPLQWRNRRYFNVYPCLCEIKNRSSSDLVAEYRYNGLGFRTGWHSDVTDDGTTGEPDGVVDGDDPWFWFCYDESWRVVATFRDDDQHPKEVFVHHAAGLDGFGGSSYIDAVVLRDRDADTAWHEEADSTREERRYYCQNWRADVVAVVDSTGTLVEGARYSAYGVPIGVPAGDTNTDLAFDSTDSTNITGWSPPASYDVRYDVNLDGAITSADASAAATLWSVRHRVLHSDLGRWSRRDPLGYQDGPNLYEYAHGRALLALDPFGLSTCPPPIVHVALAIQTGICAAVHPALDLCVYFVYFERRVTCYCCGLDGMKECTYEDREGCVSIGLYARGTKGPFRPPSLRLAGGLGVAKECPTLPDKGSVTCDYRICLNVSFAVGQFAYGLRACAVPRTDSWSFMCGFNLGGGGTGVALQGCLKCAHYLAPCQPCLFEF